MSTQLDAPPRNVQHRTVYGFATISVVAGIPDSTTLKTCVRMRGRIPFWTFAPSKRLRAHVPASGSALSCSPHVHTSTCPLLIPVDGNHGEHGHNRLQSASLSSVRRWGEKHRAYRCSLIRPLALDQSCRLLVNLRHADHALGLLLGMLLC